MHAYDRFLFPQGSLARRVARKVMRAVRHRAPGVADRLAPLKQRIAVMLAARGRDASAPPAADVLRPVAQRRSTMVEGGAAGQSHSSPSVRAADLRILHVIGGLQPGGAERQVVYTASRLRARGFARCEVVVTDDLGDPHGDYRRMLDAAGVPLRRAGDAFDPRVGEALRNDPAMRDAGLRAPAVLRPRTTDLFGEFVATSPDLVHCWLDHTNIWGGVAAALAGVPAIVLSTRSLNPRHFPHLYQPWFDEWYRVLTALPNVHLINNSRPGAADYASWLGLDPARFAVILNGLDLSAMRRPDHATIAAFRAELGAEPRARLLVSVFRIGDEKQPQVFVDVCGRLLTMFPELRVVVAGSGPLEAPMRAMIRRGAHADRFHLLGRRSDVPTVLSAASLFLLTSRVEGTPNVLIEAQHLGCPAVTTAAGGAVDAVLEGVTGLVRPIGDVEGLTAACATLLRDEPRRAAMAAAGPAFVAGRFGMERMIDETIAVYERALGRSIVA